MAPDRDLLVGLARVLTEAPRRWAGWEMLAATGVRGLRVLNESDLLGSLLLTERHPAALEVLRENASPYSARGARVLPSDARVPPEGPPFDWVDLDPYGSPVPFGAALLRATRPGGLVSVAATDLRVLAGADRPACERRYGARPLSGRLGPEGGLRILIGWVAREAAKHRQGVRPIVAYVRDYHVRAYLRLTAAPAGPAEVGTIDPSEFSGPGLPGPGPFGPMWLGPLMDPDVVGRIRVPSTAEEPSEVERFLGRLRGEAAIDAPFFFEPNELARSLRLPEPPRLEPLLDLLRGQGWGAARTHARDGAFRTTAPRDEVERLAREAARASGRTQSQKARVRA